MRWLGTAVAVYLLIAAPARAGDLAFFEDASLRSVHFFDAKEGWAVGDEGAVWHTIDGGQSWERQKTGTRASLRSVHFIDENIGWIAGREELPNGGSVGALFFTNNGGNTWKRQLFNALPGLNQVRFLSPTVDPNVGFLLGDSSDQFSTGIFKTTDGGRSWEPIKGPRFPSWHAGDFRDPTHAILAGAWSKLGTLRGDQFGVGQIEKLDGRSVLGIQTLPQRVLAVGQGGVLLSSVSKGESWGFIELKLPPEVRASMDFNAIHAVGNKVWIVGRPGSFVLNSEDQGASWKLMKTGQHFPLHGLFFLDSKRGWAVGDGGSILHTDDGGSTWKVQRQGAKRSALLLVHASPYTVPTDTIARMGADEGYLTTTLRVVSVDPTTAPWKNASDGQRFAAGTRLAGGMTGEMLWQFPLPNHLHQADKRQVLDFWNKLHAGEGDRQLLRQLVLSLRMWRPNVILCEHPDARMTGSSAATLVGEAIAEAVQQAGNPQMFRDQFEILGLQPWRTGKLYCQWNGKDPHIALDNHETRTKLEASFKDFATVPTRILTEGMPSLPAKRFYRLLATSIEGAAQQSHFLDGINTLTGEARRVWDSAANDDPQIVHDMRTRRDLMVLVEKIDPNGQALGPIGKMLEGMGDDQAVAAAYSVGNHYARNGQWFLARETFLLLVDRYPTHPLAVDAYRWLIRHASSSEARRRHELGQFLVETNVGFAKNPNFGAPEKGVQQTAYLEKITNSKTTLLANIAETRHWYRGSLMIGKRLSDFGPLYETDPAIQFCLQASRRQLGDLQGAQEWYNKFVQHFPQGPWHDAAVTELWLVHRGGVPPKRFLSCKRVDSKPHLDGDFGDACWSNIKPILLDQLAHDSTKKLANDPGLLQTHKTEFRFAYDATHLYLALKCQHPEGQQVPALKVRPRDAQLDQFDRVSILLDLDRDYGTCFHLAVDQRGCVREDCWGDVNWNPKWFVASKSDKTHWCIEAAIPLSELTGEKVSVNSAWAVNLSRITPGRGVQAWSLPADVVVRPEGMGVLIFQE